MRRFVGWVMAVVCASSVIAALVCFGQIIYNAYWCHHWQGEFEGVIHSNLGAAQKYLDMSGANLSNIGWWLLCLFVCLVVFQVSGSALEQFPEISPLNREDS